MDAGGGRFYHARYVDGKQTVAPRLISAAQAEELGADGSCVFFDKERDLSDKLAGLGRDKILKGEFSDDLTPLYLRRCQAEELWTRKAMTVKPIDREKIEEMLLIEQSCFRGRSMDESHGGPALRWKGGAVPGAGVGGEMRGGWGLGVLWFCWFCGVSSVGG